MKSEFAVPDEFRKMMENAQKLAQAIIDFGAKSEWTDADLMAALAIAGPVVVPLVAQEAFLDMQSKMLSGRLVGEGAAGYA